MVVFKETMANGNENTKAFGGIVAVLAVVAGVYAMVNPMNLRIASLENQVIAVNQHIQKDNAQERKDAADAALLKNSVQFIQERSLANHQWIEKWKDKYPILDAEQGVKLEKLEWWLYNKAASTMFDGIPGNAPFSKEGEVSCPCCGGHKR